MFVFVAALGVSLSFHPRTDSVNAATEAPVTVPAADVQTTASSTTTSTAAPTTTAPHYTAPPVKSFAAPTTTAPWPNFAPPTTKPAPSTTTTAAPKPAPPVTAPKVVATTPPTTAKVVVAPPPPPPSGNSSDMAFLACVRQRESGGNYGAIGAGYYGAYQFAPGTWDNTARHAGRNDLVGVRPDRASPADQDAMALHLLQWVGRGPWGGFC